MNATLFHPDHDQLVCFGRGLLSAEEHQVVEAHVATCNECAAQLTALDGDSLAQLLRDGPQLATCPASTPLPRFLEGPTAPFASLFLAERTQAGDDPATVPEPLRDHPRYRVLRLIGRGGMGNVYLAEHRHMGREVALKVIDPNILDNPAAVRRFRQEVKAVAHLSHPNIVQAHDADEAGGLHFLVLEYVQGQQLASYAAKAGRLPSPEACEYARQAALALQYAHDSGLVHRDIKPHNLMVTPDGRVKVLDFGLARVLARPAAAGASATQAGTLMGTPDYMPPEQARDAATADGRADIYSLGCTLYHLLTGQPPFPGGAPVEKVARHLTERVPALDAAALGLPAGLAEVVARMTARDAELRYQTAGEVAAALAPFALSGSRPRQAASPAVMAELADAQDVASSQGTMLVPDVKPEPRGRGRVPRGWAVACALFFGFVALAVGVVVYSIKTDEGEVVIETTDAHVEVLFKQNGKVVEIYDTKSKQKLVLRSGTYELELKGKPTGLKLDLDKVTVKRGDKVIAEISSNRKPPPRTATRLQRFEWGQGLGFRDASRDGRLVLLATSKTWPAGRNQLRLLDAISGKEIQRFDGHETFICAAVLSPDGKRIASSGHHPDIAVRIWDVESGKVVQSFGGEILNGVGFSADLAFAPDGKSIFISGEYGAVCHWDCETGKELRRFTGHKGGAYRIAVSPDGRRVASGAINVWEVASGKLIHQFVGPRALSQNLFLPDGNRLLSVGDNAVRLWDVRTGKKVLEIEDEVHGFVTVGSSRDGRYLRSSGGDNTVRLWDLDTGKEVKEQRFTDPARGGCVVSRDGRFAMFYVTSKIGHLWRLPDPPAEKDDKKPQVKADPPVIEPLHRIRCLDSQFYSVDLSQDNRHVAVNKVRGGGQVLQLETGKVVRDLPEAEVTRFTPDGKQVLSVGGGAEFTLREVASGKVVRKFGGGQGFNAFLVAARGTRGLVLLGGKKLRVYDWATGNEVCQIARQGDTPFQLTPDGRHVLLQMNGKPPLLAFDAETGKEVNTYQQLRNVPRIRMMSRNGKTLLCCLGERTLKVHDVDSGKEIGSFDGGDGILSGDGRRLVTGSDQRDELQVWDVATHRVIARLRFPGPLSGLRSWQLSVDGQWAVFGADSVYVFRIPLEAKDKDR